MIRVLWVEIPKTSHAALIGLTAILKTCSMIRASTWEGTKTCERAILSGNKYQRQNECSYAFHPIHLVISKKSNKVYFRFCGQIWSLLSDMIPMGSRKAISSPNSNTITNLAFSGVPNQDIFQWFFFVLLLFLHRQQVLLFLPFLLWLSWHTTETNQIV